MQIIHGDNIEILKTLPDNSVDSVVTDPPYGLSFMGKKWDYDVPSVELWVECLRVLKPGGHLLAFAGTRTQHRMAVRIEDAGFEIRDMIAWVYGSGFPKSLNVGKAVDEKLGNDREVVGEKKLWGHNAGSGAASFSKNKFEGQTGVTRTEPLTKGLSMWEGWGTALKPALEPITVARKPLVGTVAENVLEWSTGAINVDGCRVATEEEISNHSRSAESAQSKGKYGDSKEQETHQTDGQKLGRWPANFIHDGSEGVVNQFPINAGAAAPVKRGQNGDSSGVYGDYAQKGDDGRSFYGDKGSAARFFYCAKASKRDRDEGCEAMEEKKWVQWQTGNGASGSPSSMSDGRDTKYRNIHPTVKPTDLMRYLVRLVTQRGGMVLDPFMGSGSTGKACVLEGMDFIGIEREQEYVEIAKARIAFVQENVEEQKPNKGQLSLFD